MKTTSLLRCLSYVALACVACSPGVAAEERAGRADATQAAREISYDHIFLIMLENVGYDSVIGSPNAPYINKTLLAQGTLYTSSFGVAHPSLPNYLVLFSGWTQWVTNDHCLDGTPPNGPFNAPNLYSELKKVGKTALAYMESLPSDGFNGCDSGLYAQRHNPFMFFNVGTANKVPYSATVIYDGPISVEL